MALLGQPLVVSEIRGSVGGGVYTKGRSGPVMRNRVTPRNPRSSAQTTIRANMSAASRGASALSSTNKALWSTAAAAITKHNRVSGNAYNPSWITYYNSLTIAYLLGTPGGTPPTTPPTTPYSGDTITLTATGGSGSIVYTGSAQQTAGSKTEFLYQRLTAPNRAPKPKGYKIYSVAAVPATPFQVTASGLAAGTYSVGYKFIKTATGQESPMVVIGTVTVT